ncbi:R-spondin-2 [Lamellibrachia satsuma]|nr:R-spondin-2 [Lamellibrachia satsuma]
MCARIFVLARRRKGTKVYEVRLLAEQQPRDTTACMAAGIKVTPAADGQKARCRHMFPVTAAVGSFSLCPRGCATCSRINGCVTCHKGFFLLLIRNGVTQKGVCVDRCPDGYFGMHRRAYSKCLRCSIPNCSTCFDQTYCTKCTPPYLTYHGKCIDKCPRGEYYASYTKQCKTTVECLVSPWTRWSVCQRNGQTCGYKYGISMRTRDVWQRPSPGGERCPGTLQTHRCRLKFRSCVDILHNRSDPTQLQQKHIHRKKRRRRKGKGRRTKKHRKKHNKRRKWRQRQKRRKKKRLERKRKNAHLWLNTLPDSTKEKPSTFTMGQE